MTLSSVLTYIFFLCKFGNFWYITYFVPNLIPIWRQTHGHLQGCQQGVILIFAVISYYRWILFRVLLHRQFLYQFFISFLHLFIDTEKHVFCHVFSQALRCMNLKSLCLSFLDPRREVPLKYPLSICPCFLSFSVKLLIRFSIFLLEVWVSSNLQSDGSQFFEKIEVLFWGFWVQNEVFQFL